MYKKYSMWYYMFIMQYKYFKVTGRDLTETYHTGLGNRVGEQNEEDTQNCSDLDGEAAWLALKAEKTEEGDIVEGVEKRTRE